jgi:glutamine amidotransferase
MRPVVALVDYGAGNLASVRKALAFVGCHPITPRSPGEIEGAGGVVIPGVGHFGATATLDHEWRDAILHAVALGRPLLGICLGMQFLYERSEEAPGLAGLGLLEGGCQRLTPGPQALKIPHVGWNTLGVRAGSRLLAGIGDAPFAYFTHSYAAPVTADTAAETGHGHTFASACERGLVWGVQFHPEKSGDTGLRILANFAAHCVSA